jgi:glycosyltransferase involved in cell wall biosynthesis
MADFKPAGWFFKPFTTYLEETGAKMGIGLTVVSECLYNRAISLGIPDNKIALIGNGANLEQIHPLDRKACKIELGYPVEKPVVLYLGWFNKALHIALEAFKSIESDFPDAQFVCVGRISRKHDHLEKYGKLLNYAENSPRYHFVGQQPYEKVPKYLGAADLILLPMEDSIHEHARFPIRLGDFLASGRAVLASNIGEVGRIIRENKCGVLADSPEQFKVRLRDLLSNPERREWLEHLARQTAKLNLSWSGIASDLEEFYNKSFNFYSGK